MVELLQQCSSGCQCSGSCQHSASWWYRWSRSAGHWGVCQVTSTPWQTQRQDRRPPGDFLLQGYHPVAHLVSKPYQTEVPDNICRGEGTLVRGGEPRKRCWGGWGLPDGLDDLANWGCVAQWLQLDKDRGKRRGIRVSHTAGVPLPGALEWGRDVSGWCRSRGWLPTNFDAQWSQTFPHAKYRMDTMACSTGRHGSLVVGTARGPWPWWLLGICMESRCIIQSAKCMKLCNGCRQWPTTPPAHSSLEIYKFMLPPDPWFSSWDYWPAQPQ